tara:strand:+ start:70 stop:297 length:228 start_codon:yes stop_codon:yes gene_type:complete
MKKYLPQTIPGKIWVLFLFGFSITNEYRRNQYYGGGLIAFLIDFLITFFIYYFFFYALPLTIFHRRKNKKNTEEE